MSQSFMKNVSDYEDSAYLLNHPEKLKLKADNEGYLFFKKFLDKKTNISLLKEIIDEKTHFKGKKTLIVIAHRLTTVQHCDRILRLENGRIIEEGTYEEVIKS